MYALAQKYGLRPEALQTAQAIILKQSMDIEDLGNKLNIMSGASLYELWKYHERVRDILASDLTKFRKSRASGTITGLCGSELSSSQIPNWLDQFIESIGKSPNLFNYGQLSIVMARHIKDKSNDPSCKCESISNVSEFWGALASVVHGGFKKAESALCLVREREDPKTQIISAVSPLEPFDVSDTNLIIRSSDNIDYRVHKTVLALASPFFKNLLSLPWPSDSDIVDGLYVVPLSENSELLNTLISMLYPVRTVIPNSYEKVLYLLAASQKYEMASVQSFIRGEVGRKAFPVLKVTEAFNAYAIASAKNLIPEMENAARLTLDHPMTFKSLGEGLRLFEGRALRDLVNFRRRCRDKSVTCLDSFHQSLVPSSDWVGCPEVMPLRDPRQKRVLPRWLNQLLSRKLNDLKLQKVTCPFDISLIFEEYETALEKHATCNFCLRMHLEIGISFLLKIREMLKQVRDKESVRRLSDAET